MRTAIQGVIVAVKKKSAAKKVAKKAPAKRAVKKTAKKSVAKKSISKKKVAKKAPAKKATAKRAVKKSVAKKATAKKSAVKKKVAKKAPAKRAVKKSSARAVVAVSTTPIAPVAPKPVVLAPKPVATPKQGTSGRVVFLVVAGIVILAAIVFSKSGNKNDDEAAPAPSISQSAEPTDSATAEPTDSATAEPTESATTVAAVEAPSKFVALKSADGLKLRWIAPMAVDGLTGFNVEVRANGMGDWVTIATVPADQLTQSVTKSGDAGWTQFRVTSVYSDGQLASAKVFGIPGEFK